MSGCDVGGKCWRGGCPWHALTWFLLGAFIVFLGCVKEEGFCDFAVKNSFSSSLLLSCFVFVFAVLLLLCGFVFCFCFWGVSLWFCDGLNLCV